MSFNPGKINLQQPQNKCEHRGRESVCVVTTVCFYYRVKSDNQNLESNASELIRTIFYPGLFFFFDAPQTFFLIIHIYPCLLHPADIIYTLILDAPRAIARASFLNDSEKSNRTITETFLIKDREAKCMTKTFIMSASTLLSPGCDQLWFPSEHTMTSDLF